VVLQASVSKAISKTIRATFSLIAYLLSVLGGDGEQKICVAEVSDHALFEMDVDDSAPYTMDISETS
jgi:hypothetical protein